MEAVLLRCCLSADASCVGFVSSNRPSSLQRHQAVTLGIKEALLRGICPPPSVREDFSLGAMQKGAIASLILQGFMHLGYLSKSRVSIDLHKRLMGRDRQRSRDRDGTDRRKQTWYRKEGEKQLDKEKENYIKRAGDTFKN